MFRQPTRRSAYVPQPHPCYWYANIDICEKLTRCQHEWDVANRYCPKCGLLQRTFESRPPDLSMMRYLHDTITLARPCISMDGEIPKNEW